MKWLKEKKVKESSIQSKCLDYLALNYTGSFHITSCGVVEVCKRDKEGNIYATHFINSHPKGTPDIAGYIVVNGIARGFYFEVKRGKKDEPRPEQAEFLKVASSHGCICGYGTLDDLKELLSSY